MMLSSGVIGNNKFDKRATLHYEFYIRDYTISVIGV